MYTRCAHCSGLTSAACLHNIDLPTYEEALYVMATQTGTYAAKQDWYCSSYSGKLRGDTSVQRYG
jgi:fructose 1,6-bisphosphatase